MRPDNSPLLPKFPVIAFALWALLSSSAFAERTVHFGQVVNYCSIQAGYLILQVQVTNISGETASGSITANLKYMINSVAYQLDSQTFLFSIPPGGSEMFQVASSQVGYGCHGIARGWGSITANGTSSAVIASGNFLTRVTNGAAATDYVNVPFRIPSEAF